MKDKKKNTAKTPDCKGENALPEQTAKDSLVPYQPKPATPPPNKKIHPRQTPPALPKGSYVPDETPSPSLGLE